MSTITEDLKVGLMEATGGNYTDQQEAEVIVFLKKFIKTNIIKSYSSYSSHYKREDVLADQLEVVEAL